ncbi:polysaccharide deacetylase family protein [Pseudomonas sp. JV414]|uniref:polysaccharide deacetylase family protein n=1 Tax=Pseudomonas sp. JV414 TaxID=1733110 RepID=UPI0028E16E8E|nr:polysaccharide deacetylase family protein [Pseudomonas sp. JV414]MDT9678141.1 polysaccharide deacetylase family protein [Pseudomonas sp. JV414]
MSRVYMLHGCSDNWQPDAQSSRNFVSESTLIRHLKFRSEKYGCLGLDHDRDILTIDDSTEGAARACELAREAGHEVTLFVNAAQIISGRQYWFTQFDSILDSIGADSIVFRGVTYWLSSKMSIRHFRLEIKKFMVTLCEENTDEIIGELRLKLKSDSADVPIHGRVLTLERLKSLSESGVKIESHGWGHREIASCSDDELKNDLYETSEWLKSELSIESTHYAVPYGMSFVPRNIASQIPGKILLANPNLPLGEVYAGHWNRCDLTSELQGVAK